MRTLKWLATAASALLAGCLATTPTVEFREPQTARPAGANPVLVTAMIPPSDGTIFQAASYRGLFEDRRARLVGDVITINIQENMSAKRSSSNSVDRTGSVDAKVGLLPFMASSSTARLAAQGSTTNSFEGKGETGSDNTFSGAITVTVVEVLANGNLVVAGDKQVGINGNVERLRFSGVVNPALLLPGNAISSTQVADARIEVKQSGDIDRAQTMGWLQRFFLSFLPI